MQIVILEERTPAEQRIARAVSIANGIVNRLDLMRGYLNRESFDLARATLRDVRRQLRILDENELLKADEGPELARQILRLSHLERRLAIEPELSQGW